MQASSYDVVSSGLTGTLYHRLKQWIKMGNYERSKSQILRCTNFKTSECIISVVGHSHW